jgi:hypothetical protein
VRDVFNKSISYDLVDFSRGKGENKNEEISSLYIDVDKAIDRGKLVLRKVSVHGKNGKTFMAYRWVDPNSGMAQGGESKGGTQPKATAGGKTPNPTSPDRPMIKDPTTGEERKMTEEEVFVANSKILGNHEVRDFIPAEEVPDNLHETLSFIKPVDKTKYESALRNYQPVDENKYKTDWDYYLSRLTPERRKMDLEYIEDWERTQRIYGYNTVDDYIASEIGKSEPMEAGHEELKDYHNNLYKTAKNLSDFIQKNWDTSMKSIYTSVEQTESALLSGRQRYILDNIKHTQIDEGYRDSGHVFSIVGTHPVVLKKALKSMIGGDEYNRPEQFLSPDHLSGYLQP